MNNPTMDWDQVRLNGGPPCFHVETNTPDEKPRFCGRAQRWQGHGNEYARIHAFISLDDYLADPMRSIAISLQRIAEALEKKAPDLNSSMFDELRKAGMITPVPKWGKGELGELTAFAHGTSVEMSPMGDTAELPDTSEIVPSEEVRRILSEYARGVRFMDGARWVVTMKPAEGWADYIIIQLDHDSKWTLVHTADLRVVPGFGVTNCLCRENIYDF